MCGLTVCLQNFYLSLRSSTCGGISGSLPITARQLESLVRLAEARARVELRETVTADDAQVRASQMVACWCCQS
jgi:DNA helicase MCM8